MSWSAFFASFENLYYGALVNTVYSPNAVSFFGAGANIETALDEYPVFAGRYGHFQYFNSFSAGIDS